MEESGYVNFIPENEEDYKLEYQKKLQKEK